MLDFLSSLAQAPVANVMLLTGVLLVLVAAARHVPSFGSIDGPGRALCVVVAAGLLGVGAWMGVQIIPGPIKAEGVGHLVLAEERLAITDDVKAVIIKPTPKPSPAIPKQVATRTGKIEYVEWGCEESKVAEVSLTLAEGEQLLSAQIELLEIDKAKSYAMREPVFDENSRLIRGSVEFLGLDRVFFNCAGGGHARLRLVAEVLAPN